MTTAPGGEANVDQADQMAYAALKAILDRDVEGRRLLAMLSADPTAAAGMIATRLRDSDSSTAPLQMYISGGNVGKLAAIARAENVTMVENTYRSDQDAALEMLRESSRGTRILVFGGMLVALAGFAVFMASIVSGFGNDNPDAGVPPLLPAGFAVFMGGLILAGVGSVIATMGRRRER